MVEGEAMTLDGIVTHVDNNPALVIEIERLDASQPAWVNTSIPHRPVSTHTRPRAILSARFNPELHDLLYL